MRCCFINWNSQFHFYSLDIHFSRIEMQFRRRINAFLIWFFFYRGRTACHHHSVALPAQLPVFVGSRAPCTDTDKHNTHVYDVLHASCCCCYRRCCYCLLITFDVEKYSVLKCGNANWKTALSDWVFFDWLPKREKKTLTRLTNDFWKYKQDFFILISHRSCDECLVKMRGAECMWTHTKKNEIEHSN